MSPRRTLLVDGAGVLAISAAICLRASEVALLALVVAAIALHLAAAALSSTSTRAFLVELALFAAGTALGATNDWLSVVHHRVYDYAGAAVPGWMLLYWGLILRFVAALGGSIAPPRPRPEGGRRKILIQLAFVVVTRQAIYRLYLDPVFSWLPFAVALALAAWLLRPTARECLLVALFVVGGPIVEAAYIQLGGLHRYHLGWLGGVPLWIALWWGLSVLVWCDLWHRARAWLLGPGSLSTAGSASRSATARAL